MFEDGRHKKDQKLLPFSGHECLASLTKIDDNFMQFEIMSRLASSHASNTNMKKRKKNNITYM